MNATQQVRVTYSVTIELSEAEARALDGLTGYNADEFLKLFYDGMGKAYLLPHELGFKSLYKAVVAQIRPQLERVDDLRRAAQSR